MIPAGKLNRLCEIWNVSASTQTDRGAIENIWAKTDSVWSNVVENPATEETISGKRQVSKTFTIIMRYRNTLTQTSRLVLYSYGSNSSVELNIQSIRELEPGVLEVIGVQA